MKLPGTAIALLLLAQPALGSGVPTQDPVCAPLRAFAGSVAPGRTQSIEFHTVWGGDFESAAARTLYATQCLAHGYPPGEALCRALVQYGAVEFAGNNAMDAVSCLSPATRFGSPMAIDALDVSFSYGDSSRGSAMEVSFRPASGARGMVLIITAEGY